MKGFGVPLLVLGGGGYTIRNVARCWTYETALLCGEELDNAPQIPQTDPYVEYYAPDYNLHIPASNIDNLNERGSPEALDRHRIQILEMLRGVNAPSVPFHSVPPDLRFDDAQGEEEDGRDPDVRVRPRDLERRSYQEGELSDSDGEGEGEAGGRARRTQRRRVDLNHGEAGPARPDPATQARPGPVSIMAPLQREAQAARQASAAAAGDRDGDVEMTDGAGAAAASSAPAPPSGGGEPPAR
eukprot:tig00000113_g5614.t1